MNRKLLSVYFSLQLLSASLFAQSAFNTRDSVDINKINALTLVHGDMWWDPALETAHCYFPKDSHKSINFVSALWMSGYDAGGQLHTAAQTYRQDGNDYWPGPLTSPDTLTYAKSHDWAKIWKVNRTEINTFRYASTHDSASTPPAIWTWPAAGNVHARGNVNAPLYIAATDSYAPFVDLNSNGIYEPQLGDYPDVPADQALWWMFSDNGPSHGQSKGKALKVEIHALAFAYSRGTPIDNVVYYKYHVINKSANTYNNFRVGLFDDIDLGYYMDDYIGFDSTRRLGYAYTGGNDEGAAGGHPANSYGTQMPVAGVSLITLPGDNIATHSFVPAGSFIYYNNDASIIGNPAIDTEFNNYLRSKYRNGTHLTNDFTGPGSSSHGYSSGPDVQYVYPGDPSNTSQWSECASGNIPGDRRFIIASNDFTLAPGSASDIVMALVTTDPDTGNGCPNHGITTLQTITDTAWNIFYNPLPPRPVAVTDPGILNRIAIYPNPAHNKLTVECTGISNENPVRIYNTMGQSVSVNTETTNNKTVIDIDTLPSGIYHIVCRNNDLMQTGTFVKE